MDRVKYSCFVAAESRAQAERLGIYLQYVTILGSHATYMYDGRRSTKRNHSTSRSLATTASRRENGGRRGENSLFEQPATIKVRITDTVQRRLDE